MADSNPTISYAVPQRSARQMIWVVIPLVVGVIFLLLILFVGVSWFFFSRPMAVRIAPARPMPAPVRVSRISPTTAPAATVPGE